MLVWSSTKIREVESKDGMEPQHSCTVPTQECHELHQDRLFLTRDEMDEERLCLSSVDHDGKNLNVDILLHMLSI